MQRGPGGDARPLVGQRFTRAQESRERGCAFPAGERWPSAGGWGVCLAKVAGVPFLSQEGLQLSQFESSDGPRFPLLSTAAACWQLDRPRQG